MQGLLIDIHDLVGTPGACRPIFKVQPIEGLKVPLAWVEEEDPVQIDLVAESLREGVEVTGEVSGRLRLSCSRCLVEYGLPFEQAVGEMFYFSAEEAKEKESYAVEAGIIDLEQMLRDVVILGMPVNPVHDPECRGLCPQCGADLNQGDCGHDREMVDIRWAPLKSMLVDQFPIETSE